MPDQLRKGDVLVVWKLDRLSLSLRDVLTIIERLSEAKAGFRSLTEAIDTVSRLLTRAYAKEQGRAITGADEGVGDQYRAPVGAFCGANTRGGEIAQFRLSSFPPFDLHKPPVVI